LEPIVTATTVSTAVARIDPLIYPVKGPIVVIGQDLDQVAPPQDAWNRTVARFLLGYDSAGTRAAYSCDLGQWAGFCERLAVDPLLASRDHVAGWQRTLTATGLARATLARKTSVLAAVYRYAVDEELLLRSPVRGRRPRANDESTSTGLTEREAALLLDTATAHSGRSAVLIGLLYLCGLRVARP